MTDYQPIDCRLHDHIEIACLHRYRLRIRTVDARIVVGRAATTETTADKEEYLVLDAPGSQRRLRLDSIVQIEPLAANAAFGVVRFRH